MCNSEVKFMTSNDNWSDHFSKHSQTQRDSAETQVHLVNPAKFMGKCNLSFNFTKWIGNLFVFRNLFFSQINGLMTMQH